MRNDEKKVQVENPAPEKLTLEVKRLRTAVRAGDFGGPGDCGYYSWSDNQARVGGPGGIRW
jgi:hypothetical protein